MVTAYSPILKLALPVQGELTGTWGDVVNDNITSMVEQAIAGRAVINTWTANTHTLTTVNGLTSESRCAMLQFTDTGTALTGAGTVICPTASKIYIVENASGRNVTVKTSGGTGVLVPNGRTTFLFCDGTNVLVAMTHTTSLELGTSTVVTAVLDEDNMASNSATSLATQQSIKAYVDAQVAANNELSEVLAVGNVTGANDIIVTAGQKITTDTIAETTAAAGVTIDGVLIKDGGATFTANAAFGDNDKAIFGAGSDLQIYHDGSTSIIEETGSGDFRLKGQNIDFKDAANKTYAYFNQTSGSATLYHSGVSKISTNSSGIYVDGKVESLTAQIAGTVTAGGLAVAGDNLLVSFQDTSAGGTGGLQFKQSTGAEVGRIAYNDGADLRFFTGAAVTERLNIDGATGDISFYEDTGTTPKFFWDASAEALGIGTTTPTEMLTVTGGNIQVDSNGRKIGFKLAGNSNAGYLVPYDGSGYTSLVNERSAGAILLKTGASLAERMRIDGSGNVGIGTSSPQSGLEVSATAVGAITVPLTVSNQDTSVTGTGVGIGFVVDGVANVIGAQIEAERTASAYHASALKFRTKDTSGGGLLERMRIDSGGNVGIGTAVPRDLLNIFAGTGQVGTRFQNTATGTTAGDGSFVGLGVTGGATNSLNMWVYESADMVFGTSNTDRMRINSSGNVGIGTSSPATVLHVYNASDIARFQGSDATLLIDNNTANSISINSIGTGDSLTLGTNAVERMRIDASGNVGIGTSSPASKLDVSGTVTATAMLAGTFRPTLADSAAAPSLLIYNEIDTGFFRPGANTLGVSTAGTERMRIDSSGNVGIGTSSPSSLLHIDAGVGASANFKIQGRGNSGLVVQDTVGLGLYQLSAAPVYFATNSTERMRIDASGNVGIATTSPRTKLDIEGIVALDGDSGTTSSTTQTAIATYAAATFKGCKTVITANNGTDTYVTELLIANTGTAAVSTEYGQVGTGSFTVGYEVDVSGGNVRILATALNATSTTYKVSKTLM